MTLPLTDSEIETLRVIAHERNREDQRKRASGDFFRAAMQALDFCHANNIKNDLLWSLGTAFRRRMFSFGVNVTLTPEKAEEVRQREHEFELCGTPADKSISISEDEAHLLHGGRIVAILKLNAEAAYLLWCDSSLLPWEKRHAQNMQNMQVTR